ncbi:hypothetical protein JT358_03690 [Micrococcales bacterium 31B]|nr:hypothetical protein [Micrococcales bacterium 31B]
MANRSYLYSANLGADGTVTVISGISECRGLIPVSYNALLSGEPRVVPSLIWDNPEVPALLGDYAQGVAAFERMLDLLDPSPAVAAARGLLETHLRDPQVMGTHFLLEPGEVFVLVEDPFADQAQQLLDECTGADVAASLATYVNREGVEEHLGRERWATALYYAVADAK